MEHRKIFLKPVIIVISLLLISACANKMAVMETPATDTPASETTVSEAATATTEPAPPTATEPAQEAKDPNQPEVIPLDAPAIQATEIDTTTTATVDNSTQQAVEKKNEAAQAPQEVTPLPDIASITKKFVNHRNTLWLSRTSAYRLYAGGLFTTEYVPDKGTVTIKSDSGDPVLECKYTMDGKLDAQQASQQKACSTLTKAFDNYLSN